jgi:hypothetical protein
LLVLVCHIVSITWGSLPSPLQALQKVVAAAAAPAARPVAMRPQPTS